MPAAFRRWSRRLAVLLLLSLMMASLARADGLIELDVSLDPASRAFKASARLSPAEGDFRFVLLRPAGARQVAGFGAARSVDAGEIRRALTA